MRTLLFKEIDGFKCIEGFSKLLVDSVATNKKVSSFIKGDKLYSKIQFIGAKINQLKENKEKTEQLNALNIELHKVKNDLSDKVSAAHIDLIEYFELKSGEIAVTDEKYNEAISIFNELDAGHALTISDDFKLSVIEDNRGTVFYSPDDLSSGSVSRIGDLIPDGKIVDLSFKQKDELSGGRLKQFDIDSALYNASLKRSGFEIAGDSSEIALAKSKEWYQEEISKIEAKYA